MLSVDRGSRRSVLTVSTITSMNGDNFRQHYADSDFRPSDSCDELARKKLLGQPDARSRRPASRAANLVACRADRIERLCLVRLDPTPPDS